MNSNLTLVRGYIFNPLSRMQWKAYPDGALIINEKGRIEAVGDYDTLKQTPGIGKVLDFSGDLILPGLIDCHTHLPQMPIRGKQAGTLLEWLNRYAFPVEEAFADPDYARHLSREFFEALKANGTTTALVLSSVHEESTHIAFEAAQAAKLRVIMGKVMMDQNAPRTMMETTTQSLTASDRLAETWHGKNDGLLAYAFTPRFALSCSPDLLKGAAALCTAYPGSYLHSHLSENTREIQEVKTLYGNELSYTQIYEKNGCLGPRTILAHGIHLSDDEFALLRETQTRIAHCPTSNFFLKSGFFNLPAYWKNDVAFALGTDVGGGPDLSLFQVMRSMDEMQMIHHTFVPSTQAVYYATLAGAEALSLAEETGNFEPGKSADFIVIDMEALMGTVLTEQSIEETLSQLMYLGHQQLVSKTYVRGSEVYARPHGLAFLTTPTKARGPRLEAAQPHHPLQRR